MSSIDPAIMARKLAIHMVQPMIDANYSESEISQTHHGAGRSHRFWADDPDGFGGYDYSVGGFINGKRLPPTKLLITEVCGVEGVWIFSLHEIYLECTKGQLSLL